MNVGWWWKKLGRGGFVEGNGSGKPAKKGDW